ncbi:ABC transporter ATP-binding protein [Streptomyces albidoflavus]|uniref:ABC transporter ATP-binding protein n=1 Tax=Streptomyces albidoflavus TaxID=1886 RepID=UPI000FEEBB1F|nr:ABC transporter ATP-binding protein [Streptomyces albidoflavus]RWZ77828.1 ABC transporter ATP-binding protein [Streptomyces albidoflavus]
MTTATSAKQRRAAPPPRPGERVGPFLRSHLARSKGWIAAHLTGSLVWHLLAAAVPVVIGTAFDALLDGTPDRDRFDTMVLVLLALVAVRGIAGFVATYSLEAYACGLERDVRATLFSALLQKGQQFFNRRPVGDLSARVTGDAQAVNLMLSPGLDLTFDMLLGLVVPIVFIGLIDARLLLVPLVFLVLFALALAEYGRRLDPAAGATRARFGELSAQVSQTIAGMETVEATGRRAAEQRRFMERATAYRDASVRQAKAQALYLPTLLLVAALAAGLLHGAHLVSTGSLTVGQLVAFLGLMSALRAPTQLASFSIGLVFLGIAGARRILEVITDRAGSEDTDTGHRAEIEGTVVFDRVCFGHGDKPVLDDVSFTVEPGMTVALVGPTGSGKSTLLQLLNRTYAPDSGEVRVDGVATTDWHAQTLRSQISVIEQDVVLFSRSIADNLAFGTDREPTRAELEEAARAAHAHEFITGTEHGYDTLVGERGATLSGGQRQRIAIARALLADPRILVLDDSTSAVDSATEQKIQQAVRRAAAGRTTFMVTPRLSRIRSADLVLVLDRGRIVGRGTHEELLESCELYHRIFAPHLRETADRSGEEVH